VRDLLGLDVLLLYYPGHLATAVNFPTEVKGDFFMVDGLRFTICDPTFIGAGVGFFNCEISDDDEGASSDTALGFALAGGASYPVNDMVSAEGMVRAKYLFNEGSAINLEAIVGARFSF
jgi:hypothetical protein